MRRHAAVALIVAAVAACSGDDDDDDDAPIDAGADADVLPDAGADAAVDAAPEEPTPLPPLEAAPLTTDETLPLEHAREQAGALDPRVPDDMATMLGDGYGAWSVGPGEPVVARTLDGAPAPAPGPGAVMLTRFVHLADAQLADDESPARVAGADNPQITGGYRPQEGHGCRILNAAVRTIAALHRTSSLDFVLSGGDNVDNAQSNELAWFQAILDGAPSVECDSGEDDDPVPGPDDDPKDPFVAEGLPVPWWWVTGNHDVLVQGNFPVADQEAIALGTFAQYGTRDWSLPGGPVVEGVDVPADERRTLLTRAGLLEQVAADGDGHGIDADVMARGKANYTFDVGTALRFVVVDTGTETGSSSGIIRRGDLESFIVPALDDALASGRWVIVTTHHASGSLNDGSGIVSPPQPDAVDTAEWRSILAGYDNVILQLAAHSHQHVVTPIVGEGPRDYWEVKTSALADYPFQMRVIEIWDQDDGFVSIRSIAVDYRMDDDPIAEDGRARGNVDLTAGWASDGSGSLEDRNVELWIAD